MAIDLNNFKNNSTVFKYFRPYLPYLFLAMLSVITFANSLPVPFIGDDLYRIVVRFKDMEKGFYTALDILPDRPMLMTTIWINFKIWGKDVLSFRIVNILLHLMISMAIYKYGVAFIGKNQKTKLLILLSSAVYLVATINTQAVHSIIQRGVLITGLMSILSLYFYQKYLESKCRKYVLLTFVFFMIGILSKPINILFPLTMIVVDLLHDKKIVFHRRYLFFLLVLLYPYFFYYIFGVSPRESADDLSPWSYFLVQIKITAYYIKLFFYPDYLSFYKSYAYSLALFDYSYLLAICFHLSLLYEIFRSFKNNQLQRIILFVSFYLALAPESSIFPVDHLYFEHRANTPLIYFTLLIMSYLKDVKKRHITNLTIFSLVIFLSLQTINRNNSVNTLDKWIYQSFNQSSPVFLLLYIRGLKDTKRYVETSKQYISRYPDKLIFRQLYNISKWETLDRDQKIKSIQYLEELIMRPNVLNIIQETDMNYLSTFSNLLHLYYELMQDVFPMETTYKKILDIISLKINIFLRYPEKFREIGFLGMQAKKYLQKNNK